MYKVKCPPNTVELLLIMQTCPNQWYDMNLIVIYCKLKVKQALYKLKCDTVPLIVIICIESLTAKLAHGVYHSNIGVYSI